MYSIGPSGRQLNYADAVEDARGRPRRCCGWRAGTIAPSTRRTSTPGSRGRKRRPASSTCCGARDRRTRAALAAADLRAFQRHRRRGASAATGATHCGSWVALKGGSNAASSRAPRPGQLRHRRAGGTVGRRSGAGLLRPSGLFWRAPVDVLPAADREPQHAARRRPEPGRERDRAHRRVRRRLVSGLRRRGPDRGVSSGADASTAGRRADRRARRADSGRDRRGGRGRRRVADGDARAR